LKKNPKKKFKNPKKKFKKAKKKFEKAKKKKEGLIPPFFMFFIWLKMNCNIRLVVFAFVLVV